jgi:hypothetical protein
MAYYLPDGREWKGATHRMNGEIHTGEKHTKNSKVLKNKKPNNGGGR